MQETVQNFHGFVSPNIYRKLYTISFIVIFGICCLFFVVGVICGEAVPLILSACMFVVGISYYIYMLPMFSKYYIKEGKVMLKVGNIYTKEIPLEHSKIRITKLDLKNGSNILLSRDDFIIIAKHIVDIDKVLYYTDKELLKVLRTKDILAIPENAKTALYKYMIS